MPASFPISVIRDYSGFRDAWADTHANPPSLVPPGVAPTDAVHTFGITADSPANTYSAGKPLDGYARKFLGKRLDYVLYRQPAHSPSSPRTPALEPTQCDVVFTDRVPGRSYSFSDHFGLEATFSIRDITSVEASVPVSNPPLGLSEASVTSLIQALTASYRVSRSKQRVYLSIFLVSLILIVCLIVGSAWLPYAWINPIFLFVTTVLAWLATTMLYTGFLYCNYEANTLNNVIEELELYRGTIRGH